MPSHYVYFFLISERGQHALLANTSQTGVPAIAQPTASVKAIRVVCPSEPLLAKFEIQVGAIREALTHHEQESRTLAALRDALLSKLISGELRLAEAERIVGRAV
jgi:type I restriction enzyme S subunit